MTEREPHAAILARATLAIVGITGYMPDFPDGRPNFTRRPRVRRPCINCGKEHDHNNAFCSGDCCRAYREREATP